MYAAFPRSEYYQRIRLPLQHLPFSGIIHFVRHTRSALLRTKTTVDLPGPLMLPSPNVPCALTPPQSPATSPFAVAYWCLPATTICRPADDLLNEADPLHFRYGPRVALPTLSPCRYLHEPKTRFPVGRLIPLTGAGISPAGSIRLALTPRNAGRRSPGLVRSPRPVERHSCTASHGHLLWCRLSATSR